MSLVRLRRGIPVIDWTRVADRWLPFADAASADLPLARLIRLALFQVTVGMVTALMVGTLNRVMIVELGVGAWLVSLMVALPLVAAPFRAAIGLRSDLHRSLLGWKRVPFLWFGTLMLFGGLAIMPFALILLTGETPVQLWAGRAAAAVAFVLAGAGVQTTQTAGLALATDLAPEATRARVVALLYVMLLVGMVGASLVFGLLLADYSHTRLVQVVQGAAAVSVLFNVVALWKQEPRVRERARPPAAAAREPFSVHWKRFTAQGRVVRFLWTVGLGTVAFNMQDIILEPYGGEVMHLGVSATTQLTALMAGGALVAFAIAARVLGRGGDPVRIAAAGVVAGVIGFSFVIFAEPVGAPWLFRAGAALIGFGGGLFSVGTLSAAMDLRVDGLNGLVLGAWGAVQATCAGVAVALGGVLRDGVSVVASAGWLGEALQRPATGYSAVYHLELALLFATLIALGPLVRRRSGDTRREPQPSHRFGLAEFPG
ncbi:MAG: BCD family MFS transporter [Burkholderiales bacterium]|jgi:BCD family chlorophyll transporter-like MFS transporter|nr:BCD family MFS transporter [Burkholderiales bacterium]